MHQHLGGEYFNIARALVDGRGFSDPFGERSGPTAWMPPLYPCVLAVFLWVFRSRTAVATAILILTRISLIVIGTTVCALFRRSRTLLPTWTAVPIFTLWMIAFGSWFFLLTHDVWLLALEANLLLLALYRETTERPASWLTWGSLGGLFALSGPTLFGAWAVVVARFWWNGSKARANGARWVRAVALALSLAAPWGLRNAYVFHQFIPIKSNLFFDAYYSTFVEETGVHDNQNSGRHPFVSPFTRFEYTAMGERAFLAQFRPVFLSLVWGRPDLFARKVWRRTLAATVEYVSPDITLESSFGVMMRRSLYPLPFAALVGAYVLATARPKIFGALVACWLAYLLPYMLCGFYLRYLMPMTPILMIVSCLGLDTVAGRISRAVRSRWAA